MSEPRAPDRLEEPFGSAFDRLPLALLIYEPGRFGILAANAAAAELTGYPVGELVGGLRILDLILPEDVEALRARIPETGPLFTDRWRIRRADGSLAWVQTASVDVFFGGRRARLLAALDVTERERALAELRASEERLRTLVGSIDEVLFEFDREGTCLGIWTANEALLVAPREEMLGRTVVELVGEERGRPITEAIARVIDTGRAETIEYEVDLADGTHWALARIAPIPDREGRPRTVSFLARDITSRVRAEQELRRAEERWRTLVEQLPAVVIVERPSPHPRQLLVEYLSPRFEDMYGYTLEEAMDPSQFERTLHPDDRERVLAANARSEATGEPFDETYRVVRKDGRVIWVRSTSRLIRDADGRPLEWVGVELDVTEQMEAAEALRQAEERYRLVVENAWDLISLVSPDGTILYASPSHRTVLGYTPEELVGRSALELMEPDLPTPREAFAWWLHDDGDDEGGWTRRVSLRHRDGRRVVVEASTRPLRNEAGEVVAVLSIARDVTDLVRAEEEHRELLARLVSAQEEERARIAADIHDDPVQAMVAVAMQLDLLAEECEDRRALERVHRLRDSVGRAVTRLRTLLFDLAPPSIETGLADSVMELAARGEELGVAVSVEDRSSRELPMEVRTAAFRIVQEALANVRKHARARHARVRIEDHEGGVRIVVEDDGVGIPPDRVRDEPGHFGLRSMRERAALFGGRLEVGPRPAGGTRVEVWLPQT